MRISTKGYLPETLWQDLLYGLRMMRKNPGFTVVAVLTLALGIGANTSIFTLLNAVMLQSIPVRHPEQLVVLQRSAHGSPENVSLIIGYGDCRGCSFSAVTYRQLQARSDLFSGVLAMAGPAELGLGGNGPQALSEVSSSPAITFKSSASRRRSVEP